MTPVKRKARQKVKGDRIYSGRQAEVNMRTETILWTTKASLDSKEHICMQEASGIKLKQCDRQQSCHGVRQQV